MTICMQKGPISVQKDMTICLGLVYNSGLGQNADDTSDAWLEQDEDFSMGGQAPPVVGTDAVAKRRCARFEV